ncbi:MAG: hypothetical protein V4813_16625 [Gemmatimonadota bacterium]
MPNALPHHRRSFSTLATRLTAICVTTLTATILTTAPASAQSPRSTPATPAAAQTPTLGGSPDLQGLWDFTMRVGERRSTGFLALGPVERGWAGSITPDSTNTLAIRVLTVTGDSVRMIVASREGDVRFQGRLIDAGRAMEGIVEYHGGALLPMTATRRVRRAGPQ